MTTKAVREARQQQVILAGSTNLEGDLAEPEPELQVAKAGFTAAQTVEIARRRRVLGLGPGVVLSDEQVLQIADPGPERQPQRQRQKKGKEKEKKGERVVSEDAMSLVMAVSAGNLDSVEQQLEQGGALHVNQKFEDGSSLLMHVITSHHNNGANHERTEAVCLQLLRHGADVNYVDTQGTTVLHRAFGSQLHGLADLLLAHGATPERCHGSRGGACKKCRLYSSRRRKQQSQVVDKKKAAEDTYEQVLEEEFGDGDFLKELALMKQEDHSDQQRQQRQQRQRQHEHEPQPHQQAGEQQQEQRERQEQEQRQQRQQQQQQQQQQQEEEQRRQQRQEEEQRQQQEERRLQGKRRQKQRQRLQDENVAAHRALVKAQEAATAAQKALDEFDLRDESATT